ncbi:HEAT repeat domain-containing protein [bacterium]|nr:MAG: HEAT repeat domain-containing protein [bacterium]
MNRITILGTATFFALVPALHAFAQDTEGLLREFRGETPAQTRDAARWQSDFGLVLNSLLPDLGGTDLGRRAQAENSWERVVLRASRPGAETERLAVVNAMLPKLGADTPLSTRLWLLKMLEWSGRAEIVAPLVPLLSDTDPQIQERARRALANNSAPQAGEGLRTALVASKDPAQQMALINELGFRRDAVNSTLVSKYLLSTDMGVVAQAVTALGTIGTPDALKSLSDFEKKAPAALKPKVVDALLESAERAVRESRLKEAAPVYVALYTPTSTEYVQMAALRGLVLVRGSNALPQLTKAFNSDDERLRAHAARMTLLIPGPNGTAALGKVLPTLVPRGQELLIDTLAERGDASAKAAISPLRSSASDEVRTAAVGAIGYLGDASDTTSLLKTAALDKPEREAARTALSILGRAKNDRPQVEASLVAAIGSPDDTVRFEAIHALATRRSGEATPQLVGALTAPETVANEAARALGEVSTPATVPTLLAWMQKGGSNSTGEKAIMAIYRRSDKATLSDAPLLQVLETPTLAPALRTTTYKLLGFLNTPTAFGRVEAATHDTNEAVQDIAIRSLADWPGDNAIPALLVLSKSAPKPNQSILALRGIARLTSQSGKPANEKLDIVRTAMDAATRDEEKQLLLGTLGDIKTLEAIRTAEPFLANDNLKGAAAETVLRIGRDLRDQPLKDARPVFEKALAATQNENTQRDLREQIKRAS